MPEPEEAIIDDGVCLTSDEWILDNVAGFATVSVVSAFDDYLATRDEILEAILVSVAGMAGVTS